MSDSEDPKAARRARRNARRGDEGGAKLPPLKDVEQRRQRRGNRVVPDKADPSAPGPEKEEPEQDTAPVEDSKPRRRGRAEGGPKREGRRARKAAESAPKEAEGGWGDQAEPETAARSETRSQAGEAASEKEGAFVPASTAPAPSGPEPHWDLCLIVDSFAKTQEGAQEELEKLFSILEQEGLTLSESIILDEKQGWTGPVLALATASQSEFEEEAEIMAINKSLRLSEDIARQFKKSTAYGRVTAPFTIGRKHKFHLSPYVSGDDIQTREADDDDGLEYFSPCERQFLLEHIIEGKIRAQIRLEQLSPLTLVNFFPLHDMDGRGRDLLFLRREWARFFRSQRWLSCLKVWQNPHLGTEEPLHEVREYFGEQIAMYFAFISFYTRWLMYPAVVGIAFQVWSIVEGEHNWGLVAYCVFICVWSSLFIKFWERKQAALAYYWFTSELALEEKVRREFYISIDKIEGSGKGSSETKKKKDNDGDLELTDISGAAANSRVLKRNRKTGQDEYKYPKSTRCFIFTTSVAFITLLLSCVVIVFIYFYLINVVANYWNCEYGMIAGSVAHALLICTMGAVYKKLAVVLNDMEVHRTDIKYENHMIIKIFLFEFVNNFLSMLWIAFLSYRYCAQLEETAEELIGTDSATVCLLDSMNNKQECQENFREQVIEELQIKLGTLFLTRLVVNNLLEIGIVPKLLACCCPALLGKKPQPPKTVPKDGEAVSGAGFGFRGGSATQDECRVDVSGGGENQEQGDDVGAGVFAHGASFGMFGKKKKKPKEDDEDEKEDKEEEDPKDEAEDGKSEGKDEDEDKDRGEDEKDEDKDEDNAKGEDEEEENEPDEEKPKKKGWWGKSKPKKDKDKEAPKEAAPAADDAEEEKEEKPKKKGWWGKGKDKSKKEDPKEDTPEPDADADPDDKPPEKVKRNASTLEVDNDKVYIEGSHEWWMAKGAYEASLEEYGGGGDACTVDDYQELVLQFSFVTLFGVAFPLTGLLALVSNIVEIYIDSYKLCHNMRRPLAQRVSSIPDTWLKILKIVTLICIVTNIVIVFTNSDVVSEQLSVEKDTSEMWLYAFLFEHIIIVFILLFWAAIPSEPKGITQLKNLSKKIQRAVLISNSHNLQTRPPPRHQSRTSSAAPQTENTMGVGGTSRPRSVASQEAANNSEEDERREEAAAAAEVRQRENRARGRRRAARTGKTE